MNAIATATKGRGRSLGIPRKIGMPAIQVQRKECFLVKVSFIVMLSPFQLEALVAVCDAGSFERAAAALHVSPSAMSQRIAALERTVGQVLVQRTKPVVPTPAGYAVLTLARQLVVLQREVLEDVGGAAAAPHTMAIAVNNDSLDTWFHAVIEGVNAHGAILLDLRAADEDASIELLAQGAVMAAVCTAARPAPGCVSTRLGRLRYVPAATPELIARHRGGLGRMPVIRWSRADDLDLRMRRSAQAAGEPPAHYVPSASAYLSAVSTGLGWGTLSEKDYAVLQAEGSVVRAHPTAFVDQTLYWQRWKLESRAVSDLSAIVRKAALHGLRQ